MLPLIEIKDNSHQVLAALDGVQRRAGDLTPIMKVIAGIMGDAVEENFEQQGRPKWKPLAQSTIDKRTADGHWPGKILQVEGLLASSIEQGSDANSAWVGTNVIYAAIQQLGGYAGRAAGKHGPIRRPYIPPRPFLALSEDNRNDILDAVVVFVLDGNVNRA